MQPIGKALVVPPRPGKASLPERSGSPAGPVEQPAILDREVDFLLPVRVRANWTPEGGVRTLARELTPPERAAVVHRRDELTAGLRPLSEDDRDAADAALSAMLGGYFRGRQQGGGGEGTVLILLHKLRKFPAWAIVAACERINSNEADLDRDWCPKDTQIHAVVAGVVRPYQETLLAAEALLAAPVAPPPIEHPAPPLPTPEQMAAQSALLNRHDASVSTIASGGSNV